MQANLRRSEADGRKLTEGGIAVRLVKGAYLEPSDVAHAWGDPVDVAFVRLAHQLTRWGAEFTLATHDSVIREALLPALNGVGIEMLLGVRTDDALKLVEQGRDAGNRQPGAGWVPATKAHRLDAAEGSATVPARTGPKPLED